MKSVEAFETLPGEAWHPESLQATITELLYLFTGRGLLFLTITTLLMTLLLSADVPAALLFPWSLSLLALLGLRWRDYSAFRAARRRGESLEGERGRFWYRRFRDKALLTALLLGLAFPLFLPYLSESYLRYILLFFIIGTSAGSVSALFPHARLVTAYLILVNAPLFVHLLLMKEPYTTVAAMVQILFVIILLMIAQTSRLLMVRAWEQQKDLYAKERELDALFSQTPIPIFYFDTSMRVRKYNQAFRDFFRLPENFSMEGYDLRQLKHTPAVRVMERVLETRQPEEYDGQYFSTFRPDEFWILARVVPLFNEANELIGGIVSFQDKTLERQSIETLERLASQDSLTDLGNRRHFYHTLRELIGTPPEETAPPLSLLFLLDLDRFKPINDTLGHHVGDRVLQQVGRILRRELPEGAQAFRLGGDEFILLLPHCCREHAEARRQGEAFVHTLNARFQQEIVVDGYHLPLQASVGIVVVTPEMQDPDEVIRQADVSMYQAKHAGENLAFYDPLMDQARQRSFFLRQELGAPGVFDQLQLHFQPIVDLESGTIRGAEALLRWEHPTLGLLGPDDFIPIAVESGMIGRLGRWVSRQVCQTLREIRRRYPEAPLRYLSFNVDARELGYHDFAGRLRDLVAEYGIAPDALVLELTENSLIDSLPRIRETIRELQDLGFRWAIDDFGTGYSSLSYLQRLSLDLLKIDRSFSGALDRDESAAFLIRHILEIARHLGYTVVVEGIETTPQAQRLREISPRLQCQGFHFSPPLPREAFFELLGRSAPPRPPKG